MSHLVNLSQFGFTEKEIKILVTYCHLDPEINRDLVGKLLKLGTEIKRGSKLLKKIE